MSGGQVDTSPAVAPTDEVAWSWRPFLVYVLPYVVYMLLNTLEPARPEPAVEPRPAQHAAGWFELGIPYRYYPLVYTIKVALTALVMLALWRDYARLDWHVSPLAIAVGLLGIVVWIGVCELHLEPAVLGPLGLGSFVEVGQRAAFNPLAELAKQPALAYAFLAIRFLGLVVIVPIIEEMFLRGFLMRFVTDNRWWTIPLASVSTTAVLVTGALFALSHPAELFAAIAWFALVTWLMFRTRNLADCIVAHAVTNLLLGAYVVSTGAWRYM